MRLAAHEYVHARRERENYIYSAVGAMVLTQLSQEGVHSGVHGAAHRVDGPCPDRRARRVFQNGESDDARQGVPTHARPRVRTPARGAIGAHTHADSCLRSRCAGDAPLIVTAATAGIAGVIADVSAATAPLAVATRCRSDACSRLHPCAPLRGPDSVPRGRSARILGVRSLGALVVIDGVVWDRSGAFWCDLGRICMSSSVLQCAPMVWCEQYRSQFVSHVEIWLSECSNAL